MDNDLTVAVTCLRDSYVQIIRRCIRRTVERCGINATPDDVLTQIAIRSTVLRRSTSTVELCAFRHLVVCMFDLRDRAEAMGRSLAPPDILPSLLPLDHRLLDYGWREWESVSARLANLTISDLVYAGRRELASRSRRDETIGRRVLPMAEAWRVAGVVGVAPLRKTRRSPSANWLPISERTMQRLESCLSSTAHAGLRSLHSAGSIDYDGLTRLFARTVWLTGMRRSELFSCRLFSITRSGHGSAQPGSSAMPDPHAAILGRKLCELKHSDIPLAARCEPTSPIPVMAIRSAKTACSCPRIDNSLRLLLLTGLAKSDLELLWLAARLHRLNLAPNRAFYIAKKCTARLGAVSEEVCPRRPDRITLHTLRHAFADAARRSMSPPEAAAMTGHTSIRTLRAYGARHPKSRRSGRWMPQPDPTFAHTIATAWGMHHAVATNDADPPALDMRG